MEKLSIKDLQEMQSWSLERKVAHTIDVLSSFVNRVGGLDKVYLSCSFGKDSCVLLDIATRIYPDIKVVFCNTGNEHPSVIKLCHEYQSKGLSVQIIRPSMTPRQVWQKYGFPLIGKETAYKIHVIRTNPNCASSKHFLSDKLDNGKVNKYVLPHKWRYLIDEPYETHNHCCTELKKKPFRKFEKDTGRCPILGIMAEESQMRKGQWVRWGGCNTFTESPKSMPLSIWLEKDIWEYIERYNIPIAEVYRQGATRTGCVSCGFGIQRKDDKRFEILYEHYPKYYSMIMDYENKGHTFREALRKILAMDGRCLPDEKPKNLFEL